MVHSLLRTAGRAARVLIRILAGLTVRIKRVETQQFAGSVYFCAHRNDRRLIDIVSDWRRGLFNFRLIDEWTIEEVAKKPDEVLHRRPAASQACTRRSGADEDSALGLAGHHGR